MVHPRDLVMSPEEVMTVLGCKRAQLFKLLAQGKLERAPRCGRELRIYTESVTRALTKPVRRGRKSRAPSSCGFEIEDIPL